MHKDLKEKKDAFQKKAGSSVFHSTAKVHEKFMLDEDSAMYHLSLETQTPIDLVMLQSDIELEIIETEENAAIVNRCTIFIDYFLIWTGSYTQPS